MGFAKMKIFINWILLTRGGEVLMILVLIGFCLLVAAGVLIIATGIDDFHRSQDKTGINEKVNLEFIRL